VDIAQPECGVIPVKKPRKDRRRRLARLRNRKRIEDLHRQCRRTQRHQQQRTLIRRRRIDNIHDGRHLAGQRQPTAFIPVASKGAKKANAMARLNITTAASRKPINLSEIVLPMGAISAPHHRNSEQVTAIADRPYETRPPPIIAQLPAQARHHHVHRPVVRSRFAPLGPVHEKIAAQHTLRMFHERRQKIILTRRQFHRLPVRIDKCA